MRTKSVSLDRSPEKAEGDELHRGAGELGHLVPVRQGEDHQAVGAQQVEGEGIGQEKTQEGDAADFR